MGAKDRVNEALAPAAKDAGQSVSDPSENGDCENTLETMAGTGTGSGPAVMFVAVKVMLFFAPMATCPNEMALPDEMGLMMLSIVTLVVSVAGIAVPLSVANVPVVKPTGELAGQPLDAGYAI